MPTSPRTPSRKTNRGRPKGQTNDKKSYGPLGDLIRTRRKELGLGLADVATACGCSVQFISNIEHGRAPLPWEKTEKLARSLKVEASSIQAANFASRSEFQSFVLRTGKGAKKKSKSRRSMTAQQTAEVVMLINEDESLRHLIVKYQAATATQRKQFRKAAEATLKD